MNIDYAIRNSKFVSFDHYSPLWKACTAKFGTDCSNASIARIQGRILTWLSFESCQLKASFTINCLGDKDWPWLLDDLVHTYFLYSLKQTDNYIGSGSTNGFLSLIFLYCDRKHVLKINSISISVWIFTIFFLNKSILGANNYFLSRFLWGNNQPIYVWKLILLETVGTLF